MTIENNYIFLLRITKGKEIISEEAFISFTEAKKWLAIYFNKHRTKWIIENKGLRNESDFVNFYSKFTTKDAFVKDFETVIYVGEQRVKEIVTNYTITKIKIKDFKK